MILRVIYYTMTLEEDLKLNYRKLGSKYFVDKYQESIWRVYYLVTKLGIGRSFGEEEDRLFLLQDEIKNDYYSRGKSLKYVSKKYETTIFFIKKLLKQDPRGLKAPTERSSKKYTCNVRFFEKIDSPEKAYWLGFLWADGNLYNKKVQLCLATKDEDFLIKFMNRIDFNGKIERDVVKKTSRICVARRLMYEDLKKLGMVENKTLLITDSILDFVAPEYLMNMIHGYFDGDGCFSLSDGRITFSLVGNEVFLKKVSKILLENGIKTGILKDKRTKQTFRIECLVTKERAPIFKKLFYEGFNSSKDFLQRKKDRLYLVEHDRV